MSSFIGTDVFYYGILLVLVALALLLFPLLKHRADSGVKIAAIAVLVVIPLAVFLIYDRINSYDWEGQHQVSTPAESDQAVDGLIRELAIRMRENPDAEGWVLLGRSYAQLGRYPEAAEAFYEAWVMTEGKNPKISMDYAEALILADQRSLRTSAGDLIDEVLALTPNDLRGLWYGGLSAAAKGNETLAAERWSRLLQLELPDNMRNVVQQQLASLSLEPGEMPQPVEMTVITATIDIAPELKDKVVANEFMFLIARNLDQPMPPVAVKRVRVGEFPVSIKISDANVMIPGKKLSDITNLALVARISKSGSAMEAPGDLKGDALPAEQGGELIANITLNQVVGD